MMRSRILGITLLMLIALSGHALAARLMVVSDIHYLVRPLYEDSEIFEQVLRAGDGKLTQYGEELMAGLVETVRREAPDALIVTGDLSFNGERSSHAALAEWFSAIEDTGVPVWVIPGNHDINVAAPHAFSRYGWTDAPGVDEAEFAEIYSDFLGDGAGETGFSYAVQVGTDLTVALVDVAWYRDSAQVFGLFTDAHAQWLKGILDESGGRRVITASHHSLVAHTSFSRDSYLMFGHEPMLAILKEYGVPLHLSGHLHVQHVAREGDLTDAALGAFCSWPHRYAIVTTSDEGPVEYEAKALSDEVLPEGLAELSEEWFADITRGKLEAGLEGLPPKERESMAEYAVRFNKAYFSGTYDSADPYWLQDPARALWEAQEDSQFWQYMKMVMEESQGENLHFVLDD